MASTGRLDGKAVVITGRPDQMVAIQANTATALGRVMTNEAPPKNESASGGMPVANMWCTHTPKPSTMVSTVASTLWMIAPGIAD